MTIKDKEDMKQAFKEALATSEHKTCPIFDDDTIEGIKAISQLYKSGKKGITAVIISTIVLGLVILLLSGIVFRLKDLVEHLK